MTSPDSRQLTSSDSRHQPRYPPGEQPPHAPNDPLTTALPQRPRSMLTDALSDRLTLHAHHRAPSAHFVRRNLTQPRPSPLPSPHQADADYADLGSTSAAISPHPGNNHPCNRTTARRCSWIPRRGAFSERSEVESRGTSEGEVPEASGCERSPELRRNLWVCPASQRPHAATALYRAQSTSPVPPPHSTSAP